jgi:hypothetical protein
VLGAHEGGTGVRECGVNDTNQAERFSLGVIAGQPDLHLVALLGVPSTHRVFADAASALADNLHSRGFNVRIEANVISRAGRNYVFGAHGLTHLPRKDFLPEGSVIMNSEPLANLDQVLGYLDFESYEQFLGRYRVWDYSQRNVNWLRERMKTSARVSWVPIPFSRSLLRVPSKVSQDIDVLFYGRVNARRQHVVSECEALGLRVVAVESGCYGAARDALFDRSKIVLNLGWVVGSVFEQYRVNYLLNQSKAVVTELSANEGLPDEYTSALAIADYDHLAPRCRGLVDDSVERAQLENAGHLALQNDVFRLAFDRALAEV